MVLVALWLREDDFQDRTVSPGRGATGMSRSAILVVFLRCPVGTIDVLLPLEERYSRWYFVFDLGNQTSH